MNKITLDANDVDKLMGEIVKKKKLIDKIMYVSVKDIVDSWNKFVKIHKKEKI
jgi:hypothetical protein